MPQAVERYFVVPHTHWDREWYRPFEYFQLLLGSVVDEVLDTLERDPRFATFTLDGQAIVLEDYVEVRPEHEGRLRALIAAGRIEVGPSYVLPDELLVGGESLIRNLLIGRAVCERFGGRPSPAGYLPDSFGHPLQLPQILAGFGIETVLFSRGMGDEIEELGVTFRWGAPDGSSVLALQLLGDYSNFANISGPDDAEARVRGLHDRFGAALQRAGVQEVLLCNGTDHWRIQPRMPELCEELERRFPGSSFAIARYGDYVAALQTGELPWFTGELLGSRLWNVLRGVNSARLYLKQANERAERELLSVETLAALCALHTGRPFPSANFTLAWRELLKCQPHDSICGCSCDEVHRDMLVRYGSLERTLQVLAADALAGVAGDGEPGRIGLFNPLPFERAQLVRMAACEPVVVQLPGFAGQTVQLTPTAAVQPRAGDSIESDAFRVLVAADGTLEIDDLRRGRRFTGLHVLEDELDMGDLYNFCPVAGSEPWRGSAISSRVLRDGPECCELEVTYRGERPAGLDALLRPRRDNAPVSVSTVVRLVRGSGRIEFETTVDNAGCDHRLRVVFPVLGGAAAGVVRAEGQFAVVRRPVVAAPPRTEWCEPPDATQHTLGAVALGPIALFTRGLPEYEARVDGRGGGGDDDAELCLTLLRCVGLISRPSGALPTRPLGAGPDTPTPEGQCLGRYTMEYALRLDADELDEVALLRESQDHRHPFLAAASALRSDPMITLEGEVVFSCLKGAEDGDGLVLRAFNPGSRTVTAQVVAPVAVERARLDESGGAPLAGAPEPAPSAGGGDSHEGRAVHSVFEVGAGEIATLRLRASRAGG